MGSLPSRNKLQIDGGDIDSPPWTQTVMFSQKYYRDGLLTLSKGFTKINNNTIVRTRTGNEVTDGAKWSRPFRRGKHVFEIVFPRQMRGKHAAVGIGLKKAAVVSESNKSLVGTDENSWGVDLVTKDVSHNKRKLGKFPGVLTSFPDRFYMYIDMDVGSLLFGQEDKFFGAALTDEKLIGSVVYPMISATQTGATITVVYRGKGRGIEQRRI
ncbi:protein gustavus-like isoform X3 [Ostrea edulis]|uniref:protein gustavus-like isoform X3 n=1 Tax=Ostrea edulis TaxID=37623 RepID=UPI0024AF39C6|nr:protein gustavus-like isoform X3 [Ostrea edulis]XP_055996062.1 protein gustavus-like isoform X3 [Ostrea edulis]